MTSPTRAVLPAAAGSSRTGGDRRDARLLAAMVTFVLAVAVAFGILIYMMVQRVRVQGPLYTEIIRQKDLVADILPPSGFAIEAYMTAMQLASPARLSDREALVERGRDLRDQYEARQVYWSERLAPGPAGELMLFRSSVPARRMFDLIEYELIPLALAGDSERAEALVQHQIFDAYQAHREAIEELVAVARRSAAVAEASAAEELSSAFLPVTAVLAVLLVGGGLFVLIRTLRLARDRAHELAESRTAELRRITDRFERAVAGTSDGLWDWDLVTNEVYYASRVRELLGFTPDSLELPDKIEAFFGRLHPEDAPATQAAIQRAIATGEPYRVAFRLLTADGHWRWFESRAAVARDSAGKALRMAGAITDISSARAARERQDSLASMLTNMGRMAQVGWWEINLDTGELTWSDVVYDIHDLPRGKPISTADAVNFYAPEARAAVAEAVERGMLEGRGWDLELPLVTATDRQIWVRAMGEPVFEGSRVVRLIGAFQDITDRKEAEARIVESERRFRTIVEGTDVVVWEFDIATNCFTYVSPQAERFGYPLERWYDEGFWAEHVHPDDRERAIACCMGDAVVGRNHRFRYRFIAGDGRVLWLEEFVRVERPSGGGEGVVLRGVLVDITANEEAAETLRAATEALHESQAVARMGSWLFDVATGMVTWSDQLYTLFGHQDTSRAPDYATALDHYHPDDVHLLHAAVQRAMAQGEPYSLTLRTSELGGRGGASHVRTEGRARRDAEGRIIELYGTVIDVSVEVRREESLKQARNEAEAASRAKSAFLANMSHEIRTPLTAILGYTELLAEAAGSDSDSEAAHRASQGSVETIRRAGHHLLAVINDLLDLSKIEADMMTVERVETPLVRIIADVEMLCRARIDRSKVELRTVFATAVPDRIISDPTRLRQVLMNLVGNAAKFTAAGSITVTVSAAPSAGGAGSELLTIDVQDTGPGMSPEQAARLFTPFAQADESVTRKHGGTGLGLAISRRLARILGGDVVLESTRPGDGSCFRLTLPLVRCAGESGSKEPGVAMFAASMASAAAPRELAALRGRVLLAEDGIDNQRLIAFHLRRAGATVDIADNGAIALGMIERAEAAGTPYDLLLTDMQMPEMDGYTLASTLRARGSRLPIIALTAHAMADDRRRCTDAGCDDYASKPIERQRLVEVCGQWMNGKREQQPTLL